MPFPQRLDKREAIRAAWETPYVGQTANLLRETIDRINLYRRAGNYSNFLPIVQSAGTGKSRAVDQLAKYVFTIPFNLRPRVNKVSIKYPEGDQAIRRCFNPYPPAETVIQQQLLYGVFLSKLFEIVANELVDFELQNSPEALANDFYSWIKTRRESLYDKISEETLSEYRMHSIKMRKESPEKTAATKKDIITTAREHCQRLIDLIKTKSGSPQDKPSEGRPVWLLLYFDEAQELSSEGIPPSGEMIQTNLQVLYTTLDEFKALDMFAIFISTDASICDLSPLGVTRRTRRAHRIDVSSDGFKFPFVQLPFDNFNDGDLLSEDSHTIEEVCEETFMARLGRPLFWALSNFKIKKNMHRSLDILWIAMEVLNPEVEGVMEYPSREAELAMFNIRIGIPFEGARQNLKTPTNCRLVERYMHLAWIDPSQHGLIDASPPAEPLLVEAIAWFMKDREIEMGIPRRLAAWCDKVLLEEKCRHGLVLRLLLIKAHDKVPRRPSTTRFCPVRLPDFLRKLVGQVHAQKILDATPDNLPNGATLANSPLGNAFLNFNYWTVGPGSGDRTDQTAWVALGRCAAWKCVDLDEGDADHIIPLSLWDEKLGRFTVSAIFLQTRKRADGPRAHFDAEKMRFFTRHPDDQGRANSRPYLSIVVDLGAQIVKRRAARTEPDPPAPSSVGDGGDLSRHPRYAITLSSCSNAVFPQIIAKNEELQYREILTPPDLGTAYNHSIRFGEATDSMELVAGQTYFSFMKPWQGSRLVPRASNGHRVTSDPVRITTYHDYAGGSEKDISSDAGEEYEDSEDVGSSRVESSSSNTDSTDSTSASD